MFAPGGLGLIRKASEVIGGDANGFVYSQTSGLAL